MHQNAGAAPNAGGCFLLMIHKKGGRIRTYGRPDPDLRGWVAGSAPRTKRPGIVLRPLLDRLKGHRAFPRTLPPWRYADFRGPELPAPSNIRCSWSCWNKRS
ncbi:hypothetical protein V6N11_014182 [Hibiscus sabdariffa]|uniref:Uncharacterized protein n=2 Tax=Hibiscus sabdariffa TaxID=183260 RepID=A0ABR2AXU3_9ROSI